MTPLGSKKYPEGVSHLNPGKIPGIYPDHTKRKRTPTGFNISTRRVETLPREIRGGGLGWISTGGTRGLNVGPRWDPKIPRRGITFKLGENPRDITDHTKRKRTPKGFNISTQDETLGNTPD